MTTAAALGRFAASLEPPPEVLERAALHLLDAIGCGLAADGLGEGVAARTIATAQGGTPEAEVIGVDVRLPAPLAAFANGSLIHALDFDDTHPASICHITAVVGPAALAVGQARGATGRAVLTAYVAGCEAVARIGVVGRGALTRRGFHPTGVCGVFGAALAAARLLGLDVARTTAALGIAGSFSGGLLEYLADGSATKPLHAGGAAQAGVQAALLAEAGADGPGSILDGRYGLFATHLGDPHALELAVSIADLGIVWETLALAIKPYPACHFMHGCIEAVEALVSEEDIRADRIEWIEAIVAEPAVGMVLEPFAMKLEPQTPYDAKFSLPFALAAMVLRRSVDVATFTPAVIADRELRALARRVRYTSVPLDEFPSAFGGHVTIGLVDGQMLGASVDHPRGSSEVPMTRDEVIAKFRANAGARGDAVERRLLALATAPDASIGAR